MVEQFVMLYYQNSRFCCALSAFVGVVTNKPRITFWSRNARKPIFAGDNTNKRRW